MSFLHGFLWRQNSAFIFFIQNKSKLRKWPNERPYQAFTCDLPQPVRHVCGRAGGVALEAECQVGFILPVPASPSGAGQMRLMALRACHCLCRVLVLAFCTTQSPRCSPGRVSSCPERPASFTVEFQFLFPWHHLFVADNSPRFCTNLKTK